MSINLENICSFEEKSKYKNSYFEKINIGKEICRSSKVAIVSLARNCEKNLQKSIDQIKKLQSEELKFFIYENNSTDKTKEILSNNANNQISVSLNTDQSRHLSDRSRERTNNLAKYRNVCLEWVKKNCPNFDYTLVLDLDADKGFSIDGIYNSISWLQKIEKSAGMASYSLCNINNKLFHYDVFAIRVRDWSESLIKPSKNEKVYIKYHPKIGSNPVHFYSCFGGLAIYKNSCFIKGTYDGSIGCEHVLFHKSIKDKGYDMYLNPSSIFYAVER